MASNIFNYNSYNTNQYFDSYDGKNIQYNN